MLQVNRLVAGLIERLQEPGVLPKVLISFLDLRIQPYRTLLRPPVPTYRIQVSISSLDALCTLLQALEAHFSKNDKAGNLRRYLTSNYLRAGSVSHLVPKFSLS